MKTKLYSALITIVILVLTTALFLLVFGNCKGVTIVNSTTNAIKVKIVSYPTGTLLAPVINWEDPIKPLEQKSSRSIIASIPIFRAVGIRREYSVVAIDGDNTTIFRQSFSWDELHDMGWKITIIRLNPPPAPEGRIIY